jgi:hypothetical protein
MPGVAHSLAITRPDPANQLVDVCRNGVARAVGTSPCDQAVFDLAPRAVDCYVRDGGSRRTEQVLYLYDCPVRPGVVCGRNHSGVERGAGHG